MVANIITTINENLKGILKAFAVFYGVAEVIEVSGVKKPVLINQKGDATNVTVDDKNALMIYHLLNQITTNKKPGSGYGDSFGKIVNTVTASMVVFNDTGKTKLTNDELFLFLQANWPENLTVVPYSSVKTNLNNVILNSRQVWGTQYGTPYGLKLNQHLMMVNYSIESNHLQGCFTNCPEEYCSTN